MDVVILYNKTIKNSSNKLNKAFSKFEGNSENVVETYLDVK
jgi:hypothetical protein